MRPIRTEDRTSFSIKPGVVEAPNDYSICFDFGVDGSIAPVAFLLMNGVMSHFLGYKRQTAAPYIYIYMPVPQDLTPSVGLQENPIDLSDIPCMAW